MVSGDCGLDTERGGGSLKPRPRKGEILPAGKMEALPDSGLIGLDSARITKLVDRRCALVADGTTL